ncbi:cell division protein DedD [Salmonella enterica]|nr:cell division protein DedD [Salmonella enterica]EHO9157160.1 cell division protein DedD [Salmonella enterica]
MASKFQNRLVGTIVLVALGVIVLPGLLDGQKKHYQDEFAAIPLVPKPGDRDEPDMMPAATQALPTQPPEGAAEEVRAGDAAAPSLDPSRMASNNVELDPIPVETPKPKPVEKPKPQPKPQQPVVAASTPTPAPQPKPQQPVVAASTPTPAPQPATDDKPAPTGKAYVVQLGALKNADKVNEIVGKLRSAGFRVYTSPSTPVQGKITRILVGPDASKDKMKGSLGELKQISGLSGVVMGYSPN